MTEAERALLVELAHAARAIVYLSCWPSDVAHWVPRIDRRLDDLRNEKAQETIPLPDGG
jgi:hypothetical protein